MKDLLGGVGCGISAWLLIVFLALATTAITLVAYPYFENMRTAGIRQTYEYSQTKQDELVKLMGDYQELDAQIKYLATQPGTEDAILAKKQQQQATISRLRTQVQLTAPDQVPPAVSQFLATH